MDINRLYIGLYKDSNQESLFYKINDEEYCDIKMHNKKILCDNLELSSFIPFTYLKTDKKIRTKVGALKIYEYDRMQEISLSRVFLGNIWQITEIVDRRYFGNNILDFGCTTRLKAIIVKKDVLLLLKGYDIENARFLDLVNGKCYNRNYFLEYGDYYIPTNKDELKLASAVFNINDTTISKAKLLEKYRLYKEESSDNES